MSVKSYYEKLKDPRWQKRRLEVLEAAGWECVECGDGSTELHVHHILYRKGCDPWDYQPDELKALCAPCHLEYEASRCEFLAKFGQLWLTEQKRVLGYIDGFTVAGEIETVELEVAEALEGKSAKLQEETSKRLSSIEIEFNRHVSYVLGWSYGIAHHPAFRNSSQSQVLDCVHESLSKFDGQHWRLREDRKVKIPLSKLLLGFFGK